jgi:hypothetical protein
MQNESPQNSLAKGKWGQSVCKQQLIYLANNHYILVFFFCHSGIKTTTKRGGRKSRRGFILPNLAANVLFFTAFV